MSPRAAVRLAQLGFKEELERAAETERELSAHAIAHSVARVLEQDHLRIAEQLEHAGIRLGDENEDDAEEAR